jgi:hypothetical protein
MKINPAASQALAKHQPHQPPAQAARNLLATREDLAERPFGRLVSVIARGQEIPAAPIAPAISVETLNETPAHAGHRPLRKSI